MIETIISFLKLIIPFCLISFVSLFLIKVLKIEDILDKIILLFLFNWCQIILNIEILSIFKIINSHTLLLAHLFWFFIALFFSIKNKFNYKIRIRIIKSRLTDFYNGININRILKNFLIVWLLLIIFMTFFIGVSVPPNNWDSMTYHLTRVAFWRQNATLNHYFTNNLRQITMPINAEVGLLWIVMFANNDRLTFLVQWTAFVLCLIVLFKILRLCRFSREISFLSIFIFSCLTMVIMQASTTQNDLTLTVFVLIAVYFALVFLKKQNIDLRYIIFSSISLGIAIGVKGYSYLFIPGFYLFMLLYKGSFKIRLKKIAFFSISFLICIILFSFYNLIQNYISFGNIFGDAAYVERMGINNPDIKTFSSNFLKHIFSFYQYTNIDYNFIGRPIEKFLEWYHRVVNLDISSLRINWPNIPFRLEKLTFNMDGSYFGPIGFFLVLPAFIYNFLINFTRRRKIDDIFKEKYKDSILISLISIIFFLGYVYIFVWQPWAGRLMIGFVSLLFISVAVTLEFIYKIRIKLLSYGLIGFILIISVLNSFASLFFNHYATIIPLRHPSIFSINYDDRRYMHFEDKKVPKDLVDKYVGENGRLGLVTTEDHWDYIFFGKNFGRECIYFSYDELMRKDLSIILKENKLDGLLIIARDDEMILDDINYGKIVKNNYVLIYKNY